MSETACAHLTVIYNPTKARGGTPESGFGPIQSIPRWVCKECSVEFYPKQSDAYRPINPPATITIKTEI